MKGMMGPSETPIGMPAADSRLTVAAKVRWPRFQPPGKVRVQGGDGEEDRGQVQAGHFSEQVDVPFHQAALGDQGDRLAPLQRDLKQCRRPEMPLDRLIRIRHPADVNRFALVARPGELLAEQLSGALTLANSRVSKSRPGERPTYA